MNHRPDDANTPWWRDTPRWPPQDPRIAASVLGVLESGDWGKYSAAVQERVRLTLQQRMASQYVRLMASGSAALEWALRAVGVKAGDRIAISAWDYPGILRAVELCGAIPVLIDTEPQRPTMDADALAQTLRETPTIMAVVASHLFGIAAEIDPIMDACKLHGVSLIEDACQVPGMTISGRPAGSIGDVGVLSFGGSKPLSAGSGGAILTSQSRVNSRLQSMLDRPSDACPLSPLQAAALLPQFETLDDLVSTRTATAQMLAQHFKTYAYRDATTASHYKLAIHYPDQSKRDAAVARAETIGFPLGKPFRCLNNLSKRRCEKPLPLVHSGRQSQVTAILDHRMLMVPPHHWAELISTLTNLSA